MLLEIKCYHGVNFSIMTGNYLHLSVNILYNVGLLV
jgi:hypothetical protein